MMSSNEKLREVIARVRRQVGNYVNDEFNAMITIVCDAAESTLPKTKMVEVWRIWHSAHGLPRCFTADSEGHRDEWMRVNGANTKIACIRVTGPHMQEVPSE